MAVPCARATPLVALTEPADLAERGRLRPVVEPETEGPKGRKIPDGSDGRADHTQQQPTGEAQKRPGHEETVK